MEKNGRDAHGGSSRRQKHGLYTAHLPKGKHPCPECCAQHEHFVQPGYYRDLDVVDGAGKYGVCTECGATGISLGLSEEQRAELFRLRFARTEHAARHRTLFEEFGFLGALYAGQDGLTYLDRACEALESPHGTNGEAIRKCEVYLEVLFGPRHDACLAAIGDLLKRFVCSCGCNSAAQDATCACRSYCARIATLKERITELFPARGTADEVRFKEALKRRIVDCNERSEAVTDWLHDPMPYEEFRLLLLVRWYWVEAGCPKGCYAEDLIETLERFLRPRPRDRRISPEIAARFALKEVPPELFGLTGDLLADLHDCLTKFGEESALSPTRCITIREPVTILALCSTWRESRGICVIGPGGKTTEAGFHLLTYAQRREGKPEHTVLWDKRVSVEDVRIFIRTVDDAMERQGLDLIDRATGERTKVARDAPETKRSVEEVFRTPGSCVVVLPGGPDAETLRQQFDRPDEIAIVSDPFRTIALCHTRDFEYVQRRAVVARRVFKRHAIEDINSVSNMSAERMQAFRDEVTNELKRDLN